ncbi:hypothetical protein OA88_10915 [Flavobacterium sp. JRM]|nr:hypothetical protein OA88_10915 [Flavobacterium sp. JRM]
MLHSVPFFSFSLQIIGVVGTKSGDFASDNDYRNTSESGIISIDENGIVYRLQNYLNDFPEFLETDISPKLKDYNNTSPSILY